MPGGVLRRETASLIRAGDLGALRKYNIKTGFFGAHGLSFPEGLTDVSADEAAVKEPLVEMCRCVVAVIDATKWGRVGVASFARLDQINCVITNSPAPVGSRRSSAGAGNRGDRSLSEVKRTMNAAVHEMTPAEKISAMIEEQELTRDQVLGYMRQMMEIRALENQIADFLGRNVLKGASHLYAGEEAVSVGSVGAIKDTDLITSTHRGHGHGHAHGDMVAKTPEAKQEHYNKMMAEVMGRATGYCKGKGGSMHIADVLHGNLGATGIVGGNIAVATGAALAEKLKATEKVVLCFFGDGAVNEGSFHESLNMASIWDLPVVFVCENNMYGMSVPWATVTKLPDAANRACAYGIPGEVVDGMDVLAVRGAVKHAVDRARRGEGPTLIECKTYRYYGHSHSDPRAYRTKEEEAAWKARDPIKALRDGLISMGWLSEEEFDKQDEAVQAKIEAAVQFAQSSPEPDPSELETDVFAPPKFTPADYEADRRTARRDEGGARQIQAGRLRAGHRRRAARRDDPRPARVLPGRGHRPVRRRIRRDARPVPGVRQVARARHARSPRPASPARRSARPWPACGPCPRSCTSTSPRWPWTSSPTRAPRTATCSAARRPCRWSCAPRAAPGAPSPRTTPRASSRCGRTSRASTWSCPPRPMTPRAC